MRLLITGGRKNFDTLTIVSSLESINNWTPIKLLIHGDAKGCDSICKMWAKSMNIPDLAFPADWANLESPCVLCYHSQGNYNALAGIKRNENMIVEGKPDAYFAFYGGKGTDDMVKRCIKHFIPMANFRPLIFKQEAEK